MESHAILVVVDVLALIDEKAHLIAEAERAMALGLVDRGRGRIALQTATGEYVSVQGCGSTGEVGEVREAG